MKAAMKIAMKAAMKILQRLRVKSTTIYTLTNPPTESNKNCTRS